MEGEVTGVRGLPPLTPTQELLWRRGDLAPFVKARLAQLQSRLKPYGQLQIAPRQELVQEAMKLYQVSLDARLESRAAFHLQKGLFPTAELRAIASRLSREDRGRLFAAQLDTGAPTDPLFAHMAAGTVTTKQVLLLCPVDADGKQLSSYLRVAMTDPLERARWALFSHGQPISKSTLTTFLASRPSIQQLIAPYLSGTTKEGVAESVRARLTSAALDGESWKAVTSAEGLLDDLKLDRVTKGLAKRAVQDMAPPEERASGVTQQQYVGAYIEEVGHRPIRDAVDQANAMVAISREQVELRLETAGPAQNRWRLWRSDPVDQHEVRRATLETRIKDSTWEIPPQPVIGDQVDDQRKKTVNELIETEANYAKAMGNQPELLPFQTLIAKAGVCQEPSKRQAALIHAFQTPAYARYIAAHVTLIMQGKPEPFQRTAKLPLLAKDLAERTPKESPLKAAAEQMAETAKRMAFLVNATTPDLMPTGTR